MLYELHIFQPTCKNVNITVPAASRKLVKPQGWKTEETLNNQVRSATTQHLFYVYTEATTGCFKVKRVQPQNRA